MSKDNLIALSLFIIASIGFFVWGYQYIPSNNFILFLIAAVLASLWHLMLVATILQTPLAQALVPKLSPSNKHCLLLLFFSS